MTTYDEVYIFFDTNKIEARVDKRVFLSSISVKNEYFEIEKLIQEQSLQEKVHLCIPEVVWKEMAEHMRKDYSASVQSLRKRLDDERKMFGSLLDVDITFKLEEEKKTYEEYLKEIQEEFLSNPKITAKIVPYPKEPEVMDVLLEKATHSDSPFSSAKGNRKEYSDAGFKDALIFETFVRLTKKSCLGILFTDDRDFNEALDKVEQNSNLFCIHEYAELKKILFDNFEIFDTDIVVQKVNNNPYLYEQIFIELGIPKPQNTICEGITNISEVQEGISMTLKLRMDGDISEFNIIYDVNANELFSVEPSDD